MLHYIQSSWFPKKILTNGDAFYSFNKSIQQGSSDLRLCLIDPHISIYFLGNRVPNDLSKQFERMKILKKRMDC